MMTTNDLTVFFKATLWVYLEAAKKATTGLKRNWLLVVGSVIAYLLFRVASAIFSPMGFGGGLIVGLVSIVLVSIYYSWISASVQREKLTWKELFKLDYGMFFNVINVGFILFVVQFLIGHLTQGTGLEWIALCVRLGLVVVFNAIPETIIVHRYDGMHALSHAGTFTRDNWIEWFLPLVIVILPWLAIHPSSVLFALALTDPLLPVSFLMIGAAVMGASFEIFGYVFILLSLIAVNWFMLFRANLFNELETGSRRRRIYQFKQR